MPPLACAGNFNQNVNYSVSNRIKICICISPNSVELLHSKIPGPSSLLASSARRSTFTDKAGFQLSLDWRGVYKRSSLLVD